MELLEVDQERKQRCLFCQVGLYLNDESQTWEWRIDQDIGEAKHNDFSKPNQGVGISQ